MEAPVKRLTAYTPAILWALVILFIGGRSNVPTVDTTLPVDKAAHFVMYGILGYFTTTGWLKTHRPHRLLWVWLLAMSVGAVDELHQRSVPHRSSDIKDWLADIAGVTVVGWLALKESGRKHAQDERTNVV